MIDSRLSALAAIVLLASPMTYAFPMKKVARPAQAPEATGAEAANANLKRILGSDGQYSSLLLQKKSSPLCDFPSGQTQLAVVDVDDGRCISLRDNDASRAYQNAAKYQGYRDFQDNGAFTSTPVNFPKPGLFFLTVNVREGSTALRVIDRQAVTSVLVLDLPAEAQGMDGDFLIKNHAKYFSDSALKAAKFDVLVNTPAEAKTVKFEELKLALLAKAKVDLDKKAKEVFTRHEAAWKAAKFPAAVTDADSKLAVKAVRDFLSEDGAAKKSSIDPTTIKKVVASSRWGVEKEGRWPVYRIMDVTVGFKNTDEYAFDPHRECAFVTYEVKAEYDLSTNKYQAPYATGLKTGWTHLACSKLK